MVADNPNWPPPKHPPKKPGELVFKEDEEEPASSGLSVVILGVFVVWVWGAACGGILTWLILKH